MSETVDQYLLLRALVDELARCGLAGACTSPGSRSTPLVLTLARHDRVPTWSHVDERCAAFFALGVAKATGRPAAIACTSGTAAANYLPAIIEAREARVPLIVLTTDRPPELRDIGAGQTIDQVKLFGDAVKWFVEVGTHPATPDRLRWIRQLACRAMWTAVDGRPGVVHLNLALREPLVLTQDLPDEETVGGGGRADGRPWVSRSPASTGGAAGTGPGSASEALRPILGAASRGVIVAGRDERGGGTAGLAAAAFAEAVGWPLLADPLSGARRGSAAVAHWDLMLRHEGFAGATVPDVVLRVGDLPTSKSLRAWLANPAIGVQVVLDAEDAWQDPTGRIDLRLPFSAGPALAAAVAGGGLPVGPQAWLDAWRAADQRTAGAIARAGGDDLTEVRVAAELGARLPAAATLFVAASMPIRDVESFFPVREDGPRVLANRGANGIDGTTSTAFGVAAGSAGPVVLLVGDVTLAHDLGGLLAAHRLRLPLTIVVVDNGGGGIFDFLPVASQRDAFEEHVATPTGLDPAHVAQLFGLEHRLADSVTEFRAALDHGLASDGVTLIEVRSDRSQNVRLHRRISDAVVAELSGPATSA
ncbi:2-succinyl-5-enolpyruvyl-6-hydroxy-3-cyclohexene-1-carboxylate synthase [Paraconexibacter sp. AEG42_29]|uniref:2-succinyl-5-enolpyruvyl-6-hydroxy-3-cyclohexene-1-carboxylate synthase n=1 Tax=Paraconexibacter sp. AEG42_29 TaxID=2997339 RepID=A0AAU7AUZ6_9ACTN